MNQNRHTARWIQSLLVIMLLLSMMIPQSTAAQKTEPKVVRVGWYDCVFNIGGANGRRSGYAYEYQQEIASYTGWQYEYIKGSWSSLMEMLERGEIDLMSDVSYTPERTDKMLFPSLPMGEEEYFLFTASHNMTVSKEDLSTINGKRVGVNKGSVQKDIFLDWANKNSIQAEIVEITCSEAESLELLEQGSIDLLLAPDSSESDPDNAVPLCKIGSSSFYFAVNHSRPDLLAELEAALNRIQGTDRYYNQKLNQKYISRSSANLFLDSNELERLAARPVIRVGYLDNYLAFCAKDPATGQVTGALGEYLDLAADCLENAHLTFETVAYPTIEDAMRGLKNGELDCVFPTNLTYFDGEVLDVLITRPMVRTDISAIVRAEEQHSIAQDEPLVVAVNQGNINYRMFLSENFPHWKTAEFADTEACLKAIAHGQADCLLISNFRYNSLALLCQKYHLVSLSTGAEMSFAFAVDREDSSLYSILNKVVNVIPESTTNTFLSRHFTETARFHFGDFLRENLTTILISFSAVLLLFTVLLLRSIRAEKRIHAKEQLISITETDELTGLYNRDFFFEYVQSLQREHPALKMDAAEIDIELFHFVNELHGRDFGDQVLHTLGESIRAFLADTPGISGRVGNDHFTVYCPQTKDCRTLLEEMQSRLHELFPHTEIRLCMGLAPWQENTDPLLRFEQAHIACNLAGKDYRTPIVEYDDEVQKTESLQQRLLNDLRLALKNHELMVYYQPKFDIQSETPHPVSAEALVRWPHPQLGMISPGKFIPLLEKRGEIGILDQYVWAKAAAQIAAWRDRYGFIFPVSVNLSRVDLFDLTLEKTLDRLLQEHSLPKNAIRLEITESAYAENADSIIAVIRRLREKGYSIEMDDFGSGYSSLSALSSMPIDCLKMDMAFIQSIDRDEKSVRLVELILGIAKKLRIPVIAEGVETEAQLQLLKDLNCEMVQGFYFAPPLPPDELEKSILGRFQPEK